MSDTEMILEALCEELAKHTRLNLIVKTEISTDFYIIFGFIGGRSYPNCVLRIKIIDDFLAIRTKPNKSFSFSNAIKIPLCDPEMFNRAIAVIEQLESTFVETRIGK